MYLRLVTVRSCYDLLELSDTWQNVAPFLSDILQTNIILPASLFASLTLKISLHRFPRHVKCCEPLVLTRVLGFDISAAMVLFFFVVLTLVLISVFPRFVVKHVD